MVPVIISVISEFISVISDRGKMREDIAMPDGIMTLWPVFMVLAAVVAFVVGWLVNDKVKQGKIAGAEALAKKIEHEVICYSCKTACQRYKAMLVAVFPYMAYDTGKIAKHYIVMMWFRMQKNTVVPNEYP